METTCIEVSWSQWRWFIEAGRKALVASLLSVFPVLACTPGTLSGSADALGHDGFGNEQGADIGDWGADLSDRETGAGDQDLGADVRGVDAISDRGADAISDRGPAADSVFGDAGDGGAIPPKSCSVFEKTVQVPAYDVSNPKHFLIKTNADWKHINDLGKQFFYVVAGSYGRITLTRSGSANAPRMISLHNGNNLHPGKLPEKQQANVELVFQGVSHWVVDRLSSLNSQEQYAWFIQPPSKHIVLNRLNFSNYRTAIIVQGDSSKTNFTQAISIQNSRFSPMSAKGLAEDAVALFFHGKNWKGYTHTEDIHIINNEFRNNNDAIQLISHPPYGGGTVVSHAGAVIDCNHFYVDQAVYTDGKGNHDPNGKWAWTEDAIDLKAGSLDANKPVIISNNYMWGFRPTDTNGGGSGGSGGGIVAHFYVKNVIIRNNVIFDASRGLTYGAAKNTPASGENAEITGNLFYGNGGFSVIIYSAKNISFERNTVIGKPGSVSRWISTNSGDYNVKISCNVAVSASASAGSRSSTTTFSKNYFYDTPRVQTSDGKVFKTAAEAMLKDLVFTTDRYTNAPRKITLSKALTTTQSPHQSWCKSP